MALPNLLWDHAIQGYIEIDPEEHISEHFKSKEAASFRIIKIHPGFLFELEKLRVASGVPFNLSSFCRTSNHNQIVSGHPRSLHLTNNPTHRTLGSMAVDIQVYGWCWDKLDHVLSIARHFDWSIGHGYRSTEKPQIVSGFVHLDRRVDIGLNRNEFYY